MSRRSVDDRLIARCNLRRHQSGAASTLVSQFADDGYCASLNPVADGGTAATSRPRVGQIPVEIALAGLGGAGIAAAHGGHDVSGRELRDDALGARALRARCDQMSSSVLYQRLGELTEARLIARDADGRYLLTNTGRALSTAIEPLDSWATAWAGSGNDIDAAVAPSQE